MKQSGYLAKQKISRDVYMDITERITKQLMLDVMQTVFHNRFGFGYDRLVEATELIEEAYEHYYGALNTAKNKEADVLQEHLDRELLDIVRGHQELVPFKERYPEIAEIRYALRRK